ncbi:MAG: helix-turn-helix domain-containing protein [Verrucomicrobiota bacterium]
MNGENTFSDEKLLKKREVAERFSCSTRTVDRLVNSGRMKRVKIMGGIRFRLSEVQILMNGGNHDFQS